MALAAASVACSAATVCLADEIDQIPPEVIPAATGNRIAYVTATGYGEKRRYELVSADTEGNDRQVVVASREPLMSPAWSPDGQRLAYVGYLHGRSAIFVVDLFTHTPRVITQEPGVNGAPTWSPDGKSLAVSLSFGSNADIYTVDLATGNRQRLTDHPAIDTEPSWSPNGNEIAFTSDRSGLAQVYIVGSAGGDARRITFEGRKNMRPSYSPDGDALAVVSYQGSRSRIGLLNLGSRKLAYVSDGPMDESPSFAPDGDSIIYADVQAASLAVVTRAREFVRNIPQQGDVHEVVWSSVVGPARPSSDAVFATATAKPEAAQAEAPLTDSVAPQPVEN
jgi:TolB protein